MKRLSALLVLCALLWRVPLYAQNADDQYVHIYSLIQEGDTLNDAHRSKDALNKYLEAQTNLVHFQKIFPSWNALVVDFRMSYLTGQIGDVKSKLPAVAQAKPTVVAAPAVAQKNAEQEAQLNALRTQVGMLETERQNLESKLKEAFAAQPAAIDPHEYAKAQEDVRNLQKQNDLLKTSLAQAQAQAAKPVADPKVVAQLKQQLDDSNRQLAEASDKASKQTAAKAAEAAAANEKLAAVQQENDALKTSLRDAQASVTSSAADTKAVAQLKQQLEESNRKLAAATDASSKEVSAKAAEAAAANEKLAALQKENDSLKTGLQTAQANATASAADTAAVAKLKQQLTDSNSKLSAATDEASKAATAKASESAAANDKLAALQKENDKLSRHLTAAEAAAAASAADTKSVALLKQQLADSNRKLADASDKASKLTTASERESTTTKDKLAALQRENEKLKANLGEVQASASSTSAADNKTVAQLKQQLADSNRKLTEASDKTAKLETAHASDLAAANEKLATLQRDNETLKGNVKQAQAAAVKSGDTAAVDQLKKQLADSNAKLTEATERANQLTTARTDDLAGANKKLTALQKENETLKDDLALAQSTANKTGDTKEADLLKQQLADSNAKLAEATDRANKLAADHAAPVPAPAPVIITDTKEADTLRAENDVLKKQLAAAQTPAMNPTPVNPGDAATELSQTKAQLAAAQSDAEILKLENLALANRAAAGVAAPVSSSAIVAQPPANVRAKPPEATKPSAQTQKKKEAKKQLAQKTAPPVVTLGAPTTNSAVAVTTPVQSTVKPVEAPAAPYTPEQLAQFKQPPTALSTNAPEATVDAPKLLTEAQQYFANGQFAQAEDDYAQVLKADPTNVFVLANLAAIEVELNKYDDADKHIQQAVALAPNDAYNLSVLGNLRFHQERYDDALTVLNKAAEISPQSAEIQNYLGVTLSHKGLREQAEGALRKAIQLDPKYGGAHNNLAVIYLAQNPPFVELARWHYQKALAAGFPHNAELEKELDEKSGVTAPASTSATVETPAPAETAVPTNSSTPAETVPATTPQ